MVPVGVGERGLGVLALMTVDIYRRWRRYEIQAVQQCAGYLAQTIAQLRLNEMQVEQVRRLTELDRQKTDFMATVSHELRTPLTSISGYLELLEDGDYGDLAAAQRVGPAGHRAQRHPPARAHRGPARAQQDRGDRAASPTPRTCWSATSCAGSAEMLQPVAAAGGVHARDRAVDPVPEGPRRPHPARAGPDQPGVQRREVHPGRGGGARSRPGPSGAPSRSSVADTGIGIPEKDQAKLFDRFFRASNANAQAIPGTGLGLAIVRAIVEGHGGELTFVSVEGEGTTMTITLPLLTGRPPPRPRRRRDAIPAVAPGNAQPLPPFRRCAPLSGTLDR